MNSNIKISLLCVFAWLFLFLPLNTWSQSSKIIRFPKNYSKSYLQGNTQYEVFYAYGNKIVLLEKNELKQMKIVELKGVENLRPINLFVNKDEIIVISPIVNYRGICRSAPKEIGNDMYVFNLYSGELKKHVKVDWKLNDNSGYYSEQNYNVYFLMDCQKVVFYKNKEVFKLFDFNLDSLSVDSLNFDAYLTLPKNSFGSKSSEMLHQRTFSNHTEYNKRLIIKKDNYNAYVLQFKMIQSASTQVHSEQYKDFEVSNQEKSFTFPLEIDKNQVIVDFEASYNTNGHLLLYGKSYQLINNTHHYQLFSVLVNPSNLKSSHIQYVDIDSINYSNPNFKNSMYYEFIHSNLEDIPNYLVENSTNGFVKTLVRDSFNKKLKLYSLLNIRDNGFVQLSHFELSKSQTLVHPDFKWFDLFQNNDGQAFFLISDKRNRNHELVYKLKLNFEDSTYLKWEKVHSFFSLNKKIYWRDANYINYYSGNPIRMYVPIVTKRCWYRYYPKKLIAIEL